MQAPRPTTAPSWQTLSWLRLALGRQAQRAIDHRQERGVIPHFIERRAGLDRIAGVIALILQLPLAELRAGCVPGELRQPDLGLGIAVGAAVVAMDIGADLRAEICFGRVRQNAAGAEHLGESYHALI